MYSKVQPKLNEDEIVAQSIGLPEDKLLVRRMLLTGEPLPHDYLGKISTALGIDLQDILPFEGQPLRIFYARAVCGGVLLRLGANPAAQRSAEVPIAFQSALAGVLLAAELVAKAAGLKACPPPVATKLDLLRPLGKYTSFPAVKSANGNCICQDPDYVRVFRKKYGRN
jgi:hypothetical protein